MIKAKQEPLVGFKPSRGFWCFPLLLKEMHRLRIEPVRGQLLPSPIPLRQQENPRYWKVLFLEITSSSQQFGRMKVPTNRWNHWKPAAGTTPNSRFHNSVKWIYSSVFSNSLGREKTHSKQFGGREGSSGFLSVQSSWWKQTPLASQIFACENSEHDGCCSWCYPS